ncbi:MAG: ANTAR domain-containing protein [Actinobacteria bacterium]|nr:ANTAR domain-containing protein [Actinomycetota bacterium]
MQDRRSTETVPSIDTADESALESRLQALEAENAQLRQALESRVLIEQAKGCVSARCDVPIDAAFEMIRRMTRSARREIHEFAAEIVANRGHFTAE